MSARDLADELAARGTDTMDDGAERDGAMAAIRQDVLAGYAAESA